MDLKEMYNLHEKFNKHEYNVYCSCGKLDEKYHVYLFPYKEAYNWISKFKGIKNKVRAVFHLGVINKYLDFLLLLNELKIEPKKVEELAGEENLKWLEEFLIANYKINIYAKHIKYLKYEQIINLENYQIYSNNIISQAISAKDIECIKDYIKNKTLANIDWIFDKELDDIKNLDFNKIKVNEIRISNIFKNYNNAYEVLKYVVIKITEINKKTPKIIFGENIRDFVKFMMRKKDEELLYLINPFIWINLKIKQKKWSLSIEDEAAKISKTYNIGTKVKISHGYHKDLIIINPKDGGILEIFP